VRPALQLAGTIVIRSVLIPLEILLGLLGLWVMVALDALGFQRMAGRVSDWLACLG